jgi:hypothetical protein
MVFFWSEHGKGSHDGARATTKGFVEKATQCSWGEITKCQGGGGTLA